MSQIIVDDKQLRNLPIEKRFLECESILKTNQDESLRWDAIWLTGEIADEIDQKHPLFEKISDLMVWVLKNDENGVVKHEACYQIAARDMRNKIPDLVDSSLRDPSVLTRHEALEALGLMRAIETKDRIQKAVEDENKDVRETAEFVLKRFERLKNRGKYQPSEIL